MEITAPSLVAIANVNLGIDTVINTNIGSSIEEMQISKRSP